MTGLEIRELRVRLGLTQQAMATRLGCALNTIARLEGGKTRMASRLLERRILEEFGDGVSSGITRPTIV